MLTEHDAVCTVVSRNYLHFANVLIQSVRSLHPGLAAFVLVVDECAAGEINSDLFTAIPVSALSIPAFRSIAFKYDILELNTGVKPTFFQYLFEHYGVRRLLYFDPDIFVYGNLNSTFDRLSESQILLTPHTLRPIDDGMRPDERDFLRTGVFNLGFLGMSAGEECAQFLDWWEDRCLRLGYADFRNGYFVDQKWTNLVPCYFDKTAILKDPGCNVAYWNLHERYISSENGNWYVNSHAPLVFFHFSGISIDDDTSISRHTNRMSLSDRPDLVQLFQHYRRKLCHARSTRIDQAEYAWSRFSNGDSINKLCRTVYSLNMEQFKDCDPFDANAAFYFYAKRLGLLSRRQRATQYTSMNTDFGDARLKVIHSGLRTVLRVFGPDKYTLLCKYLSHIAILRNQGPVFEALSRS